jgi:hypothetical protein
MTPRCRSWSWQQSGGCKGPLEAWGPCLMSPPHLGGGAESPLIHVQVPMLFSSCCCRHSWVVRHPLSIVAMLPVGSAHSSAACTPGCNCDASTVRCSPLQCWLLRAPVQPMVAGKGLCFGRFAETPSQGGPPAQEGRSHRWPLATQQWTGRSWLWTEVQVTWACLQLLPPDTRPLALPWRAVVCCGAVRCDLHGAVAAPHLQACIIYCICSGDGCSLQPLVSLLRGDCTAPLQHREASTVARSGGSRQPCEGAAVA